MLLASKLFLLFWGEGKVIVSLIAVKRFFQSFRRTPESRVPMKTGIRSLSWTPALAPDPIRGSPG
jgi:hypothetical protein